MEEFIVEQGHEEEYKKYEGKCDNHNEYMSCCELVKGNSIDIEVEKEDCEVRADLVVNRSHTVRIWGQVKDCEGDGVSDVLVKLLKVLSKKHGKYVGVAHTITDCQGFYQFDVAKCEKDSYYKIIVGKAATGSERVVIGKGNCDPCKEDPCKAKCD